MKTCDTKERLLNTAHDLIWTQSYGSVGVEEICRRAGIQKGSFYHFFPSKMDLAVAAIDAKWEEIRPVIDEIFSPDAPPLRRLMDYCEFSCKKQKELKKQFGFIPGCPLVSLGSEQGPRQKKVQEKVRQMLDRHREYFETAIRDAQALGQIPEGDPKARADRLFSHYLGVMTRARITNDITVLRELKEAFLTLLGAREEAAV